MQGTYKSKNNWFERNPLKTIFIIVSIFFLGLLVITEATLSYKSNNIKKVTIKRSIRLRELEPFTYRYEVPTTEDMKTCDSLVKKPYLIRVDEDGFIMPSKIHVSPDLVLVFLGGSTTECLYVNEENRFPYLTGRDIENKTGLKVNSYNSGVSSNNSLHSINILLNKVLKIRPNIVVMMHNINDLAILLHEKTYWNRNVYRSNIIEEKYSTSTSSSIRFILKGIKNLTIPNTYNAVLFSISSMFGLKQGTDEFQNIRNVKISIDKSYLLKEFRSNLLTFIDICFSRDINPVLMTQANRLSEFLYEKSSMNDIMISVLLEHGISPKQFLEIYEIFNQAIRDVGRMKNVKVIDLDRSVPRDKKYIFDTFHYNDSGSILVANIISAELLPLIKAKVPQ
jgi:lysophospholipase L1-like esterase